MSNNSNTPPPWSEAPPWANWIAQDKGGSWYWYRNQPVKIDKGFGTFHRELSTERQFQIAKTSHQSKNWASTLEKRPENE